MLIGHKPKPVAIKTLVEFAAKTGSLDRKFTPSPTGQEGIEGHQYVTSNRPDTYQAELKLSIEYGGLTFRGRADGYAPNTHYIEEIKTFYGDVDAIPENYKTLHWAQAKCYGWIFCTSTECDSVNIAVIYFNLTEQKEYRIEEIWEARDLKKFGETLANKYLKWNEQISKRLSHLHNWIEALTFHYSEMHNSQRVMAEAVYKAAATGRVVLAEAPTGTGKTLAGLFPAIKSMTRTAVDKVFYLTAKTTGKQLALENIQLIASDSNSSPLRTLELTAQEKSCLQPDKQCTGESCIYAFNFYDKLERARKTAYEQTILDKQTLKTLALEFEICPFYLSMEMSRWVDITIADVNYYFDGTPLLLGLTNEFNWNPYLLVDESHNLIDRARQMYSAELDRGQLLAAKKLSPANLKKSLERANKYWLAILKDLPASIDKFAVISAAPEKLTLALLEFTNDYIALLQKNPEHNIHNTVAQDFFFAALNYLKVTEVINDDYCIDIQNLNSKQEILTLRNLIPARLLAQRLTDAHCACFFSATLHPAHYYQSLLGLPEDTVHLKVPSPFNSNQLDIHIAHHLSTRFRDRIAAIKPICNIILEQIQDVKGNALVFFSSYELLQKVERELIRQIDNHDIELLVQSRRMSEEDRQDFIDQFGKINNVLGLAVLGGAFSEGIDLSGDALKGVFIATLGLPQVNPINEHLQQVMQEKFQQGYDFTYTYPGIQKIIQAAGRVIRTKKDTGYLWLLDDRFGHANIQKLLPDWWQLQY